MAARIFATFKHRFLTRRTRCGVKNCWVPILKNSIPVDKVCDASTFWFHFSFLLFVDSTQALQASFCFSLQEHVTPENRSNNTAASIPNFQRPYKVVGFQHHITLEGGSSTGNTYSTQHAQSELHGQGGTHQLLRFIYVHIWHHSHQNPGQSPLTGCGPLHLHL